MLVAKSISTILTKILALNFRERAIEFMLEHTARTRDNIEREVNR